MYMMSGLGQEQDYCPVAGQMCFKSKAEQDTARNFCDSGHQPARLPGTCPNLVIGPDDVYRLNPCDIASFDLCTPEEDPSGQMAMMVERELADRGHQYDYDAEGSDRTMWYVGGAVALLAIGGIAYFMTRK